MAQTRGRLIFDSARAGSTFGVRSGFTTDRSLLFRSPELSVDLIVHTGPDDLGLFQGQVVRERGGGPVDGAVVRLGTAEPMTTDEFGHFALSDFSAFATQTLTVRTAEAGLLCEIPAVDGAWSS